ncbi:Hsp20/alpha crystallin family protein, partial [Teladorsagia circumcincta]
LPWTTETAILPSLLDEVFSQLEQFDDVFDRIEHLDDDEQFERTSSSVPRVAKTERKADVSAMSNLEKVVDQDSKLSFSLDNPEFKPDEVKVSIEGRTLTVEGKREITEGSNYTSRSFLHRRTLPENVDVNRIRSTLTEFGQLTIEVPKPKPGLTARTIPIRKSVNRQ